jgi:hypothetical protein
MEVMVPLSMNQRTAVRRGLQKARPIRIHVPGTWKPGSDNKEQLLKHKFFLPYSEGKRFMRRYRTGLGGRFTIIPSLQSHFSPAMIAALGQVASTAAPSAHVGEPQPAAFVDSAGQPVQAVPQSGSAPVHPSQKKRSVTGRGTNAGVPSDAEMMKEIEALTDETKQGSGSSITGHKGGVDPQAPGKIVKSTKGAGMSITGAPAAAASGAGMSITGNVRGSGFPGRRAPPPAQSSPEVVNMVS